MSQYILSLSYGKDSLACLGAIEKLGWPLDRIVHAEIWATDTISADLPPMLEFKKKADAIIKERFGIEVEHVCAMRGGEKDTYERRFYDLLTKGKFTGSIKGFPLTRGAWCKHLKYGNEIDLRGYLLPPQDTPPEMQGGGSTDSRCSGASGATRNSSGQPSDYGVCQPVEPVLHRRTQEDIVGFPISIHRGNWCTALKTSLFRQPRLTGGG